MRLLAICGSLRSDSSNIRLLKAIGLLAPPGWAVIHRAPLDQLPFFNPDVEQTAPPTSVLAWREQILTSGALAISSPEYAHGVPGVLKNALDWLVGGIEIVGKPIAVFNASPPASYAQASLIETLRVMGGHVIPEASVAVPLRGSKLTPEGIAGDPSLSGLIGPALAALAQVVDGLSHGSVAPA